MPLFGGLFSKKDGAEGEDDEDQDHDAYTYEWDFDQSGDWLLLLQAGWFTPAAGIIYSLVCEVNDDPDGAANPSSTKFPVQIKFHAEVNAEKTGDDGDLCELVPSSPIIDLRAHVAVI